MANNNKDGLSAEIPGTLIFGVKGEDGATFTPAVAADGTVSWENDKGLENPAPVNIRGPEGPAGQQGPQGPAGKSAYEYARDGGYTGTEEEFAELMGNPDSSENAGFAVQDTAPEDTSVLWVDPKDDTGNEGYVLPVGGDELGGVKNGGNVVINADGTMTAPEVSGGSGIAVTGATVGQTVKIAAVDSSGVPTAWEPVDLPSGGGEEWVELANVTLEEDAVIVLDIGEAPANFKKLRIVITAMNLSPGTTSLMFSIPTSAETWSSYYFASISSFGKEDGRCIAFVELEPLIESGFSKVGYSWAEIPSTVNKASDISYIRNSYDYERLLDHRYFKINRTLTAGTTVLIKGCRK